MSGALLTKVLKNETEWKRGKILHGRHLGYRLTDESFFNYSGIEFKPRPDRLGRMMNLVRADYTENCPSPPGGQELFAKGERGFYVPFSKCKQCLNYKRPATRGRRFPACEELIKLRVPHVVGGTTIGILKEAVGKANDLLRGKVKV